MSDQVKAVLMPWSNGINTVSEQFAGLERTAGQLASEGQRVKGEVDRLVASLCQDPDACVEETYDLLKQHGELSLESNTMPRLINTLTNQFSRKDF